MAEWVKLAVTFSGWTIAVLGFIKWAYDKWEKRKNSQLPVVLGRVTEVYRELAILKDATGALRALVLRAENGGQIPQVGHDLHSSVVYESFREGEDPVAPDWHHQRIDESYVRMLARVISNGNIIFGTKDLPKECLLRDVYESNNVHFANVVSLDVRPKEFFYLSLTFDPLHEGIDDPKMRYRIRSSANRLARLLKDV